MILGVVVMAVWAIGGGSVTVKPDGNGPVKRNPVVYPIVQPYTGGQR